MSKSLISVLSLATLCLIISCSKHDDQLNLSKQQYLLSQLKSKQAIQFFDRDFIINNNSNLLKSLTYRDDNQLLDSLFSSLLELELADPFTSVLIQIIGYPVWGQAIVFNADSAYPTIVIPTVKTNDTLSSGLIASSLYNGEWLSSYITRDTLYYSNYQATVGDPNIPAYLLSMLFYDYNLFMNVDTVLENLYYEHYQHFQQPEEITPRSCETITEEWCYYVYCGEDLAFNNNEITTRSWCLECETWTHIVCGGGALEIGGGGTGGGISFPLWAGFATGGGAIGTSGDDIGNGCGFSDLTHLPLLCNDENQVEGFSNLYNSLLNYLTADLAKWLREKNDNNLNEQIVNWKSNHNIPILNLTQLLTMFKFYSGGDEVSPALNDFNEFADFIIPFISGLSTIEQLWLDQNIEFLNMPEIADFLSLLNTYTCTSFPDVTRQFLAYELDFTPDSPQMLHLMANTTPNVIENYKDLLHHKNIFDPADSTQNERDILQKTAQLCYTKDLLLVDEDHFYDAIGQASNFVEIVDLDKDSKLKCVYELLKNYNMVANILDKFDAIQGKGCKLRIQYDYDGTLTWDPDDSDTGPRFQYPNNQFSGQQKDYADTEIRIFEDEYTHIKTAYSYMTWNKFFPSLTPIEMCSYFIHEMLHAEFQRMFSVALYPDLPDMDDLTIDNPIWTKIVELYYPSEPINTHQHAVMANHFLNQIVDTLWELNGEIDVNTKDNYKYFVYDLFDSDPGLVEHGFLTQSELDNLKSLNSNVTSNTDCN